MPHLPLVLLLVQRAAQRAVEHSHDPQPCEERVRQERKGDAEYQDPHLALNRHVRGSIEETRNRADRREAGEEVEDGICGLRGSGVREARCKPESERDAAVTERFANLGNVTFAEYVLGIICAGEETGVISQQSTRHPHGNQESWHSI